MARIGQARALPLSAALFAGLALVSCIFMWDFTVDDALISVRYAQHVASGAGWRFNAAGRATDGVTPLPWPIVLAPLASSADGLAVLLRAKCMNAFAWLAAASALGVACARARASWLVQLVAALAIAASVPIAAHAVSGMETGVAMALATFAALAHARPIAAGACAGLAASLRPEMLPWALVLAAGFGRAHGARKAVLATAIAVAPFSACVVARLVAFGRPAPLALLAKPSDLSHGAIYAVAALLVGVTPVLAASPIAAWRARGPGATIVLAGAAHALAIAAVGGDWMPYARLLAPVAPSLAYAFVLLAPSAHRLSLGARASAAIALGAYVWASAAPAGRHVGRDRARLVAEARPYLHGAHAVASLDVGWVGAAFDGTIVDCAGVTDPEIAALPGGHTSKRVDVGMLLDRGVDRVVLFAEPHGPDWRKAVYARVLEARLASDPLFADKMRPIGFVRLGGGTMGYFVFERI